MQDTRAQVNTTSRPSFPQRVYNVLKLSEDRSMEHIISWVNNGMAFKVHDVPEFERELLPRCFNTQKYSSFTRTLCAFGFNCVRTGRQTGIYSHPRFIRNESKDLYLIKRVKNKNATRRGGGRVWNSRLSEELKALKKYDIQHHEEQSNNLFALSRRLLDNPIAPKETLYYKQRDQIQERDDFEPIPLSPSTECILRNKFAFL